MNKVLLREDDGRRMCEKASVDLFLCTLSEIGFGIIRGATQEAMKEAKLQKDYLNLFILKSAVSIFEDVQELIRQGCLIAKKKRYYFRTP